MEKPVDLLVTTGADGFVPTEGTTLEEILLPFERNFTYIHADYKGLHAIFGPAFTAKAAKSAVIFLERIKKHALPRRGREILYNLLYEVSPDQQYR